MMDGTFARFWVFFQRRFSGKSKFPCATEAEPLRFDGDSHGHLLVAAPQHALLGRWTAQILYDRAENARYTANIDINIPNELGLSTGTYIRTPYV